jgi:hypothetical protein
METFSHVLLVYASIGKIMDMWLTSIKNFSDGGINAQYPMGLVMLVAAIRRHHLPHRT